MTSHFYEFEKNKKIIKKCLVVIGVLIITSFLLVKWICFQQKEINKLKQTQQIEIQNQVQVQKKQVQIQEQQSFQKIVQDKDQDNISLRKTIQSISSRGTQPKNYTLPNRESLLPIKKKEYVGEWTITFYTPSKSECGNTNGITKSGELVIPGYSIAIDPAYWGYHTKFYFEGLGLVEAVDSGNKVLGKNRADICVFNKDMANQLGTQKRKVWLVD